MQYYSVSSVCCLTTTIDCEWIIERVVMTNMRCEVCRHTVAAYSLFRVALQIYY